MFGIINQIIQKTQSLQILIRSLTTSKTLGDHPRKRRWGKDDPFLSFATKCKCRPTYDLNVEAIFFCNWARLSRQPADLMFLTSTLLMRVPATAIT